jgi:hypothetical protein
VTTVERKSVVLVIQDGVMGVRKGVVRTLVSSRRAYCKILRIAWRREIDG